MSSARRRVSPATWLERDEQANVRALLELVGFAVYTLGTRRARPDGEALDDDEARRRVFSTRQTPGIPDLYALQGRAGAAVAAVWIECKRPGGDPVKKLSQPQAEFRELCRANRVEHIAGGVEEVNAWLVAHGFLSIR
jgi:hypothetical protein